jgi:formamidopyrimidine-DNA glycosylase
VPELPEVETTCRGLAPELLGHRIRRVLVRETRLRWPLPRGFAAALAGRRVVAVGRRAKYLLIATDEGTLIVHLGMSGSLRVVRAGEPARKHDHVDLVLDSGRAVRFNDPRRFGTLLYTRADPARHRLLRQLGPEPLDPGFGGQHLHARSRGRRVATKHFIMDAHQVVGVGNIYASEALYRARIRPGRPAGRLSHADCARLALAIKRVLASAIRAGGTTLRDYVNAEGLPGYFRQKLYVYERAGLPCRRCGTAIRRTVHGARASYYCPGCQA